MKHDTTGKFADLLLAAELLFFFYCFLYKNPSSHSIVSVNDPFPQPVNPYDFLCFLLNIIQKLLSTLEGVPLKQAFFCCLN